MTHLIASGSAPAARRAGAGFLVSLLLAPSACVQVPRAKPVVEERVVESVLEARVFESRKGNGTLPYQFFAPRIGHDQQRFPVVLFLHGAGERGTDNQAQMRHGVKTFLSDNAQTAHPCFVVAPQCPRGIYWMQDGKLDLCRELLDELAATQPVDPNRIYVTGLSMGGYGTWHLLASDPTRFAAAVPICGGGPEDAAESVRKVPIWAFHGDADNVVSVEESRAMVRALRAAGGKPKYTEYEGVRHNSWTSTYDNREVHDWMFGQRVAAPMPRSGDTIVFFGDSITEQGAEEHGYIGEAVGYQRKYHQRRFHPVGAGVSGNRVPDLLERLDEDVLAKEPDVVVIYIGINDVWHFGLSTGKGTPRAEFRAGLLTLVARIRAHDDETRVLLCTPSVIGERHDGTNPYDEMLEDYSEITRKVVAECGLECVDLRVAFLEALREHNEGNVDRGVFTVDGVHLNVRGNRLVGEAIGGAIVGAVD